MATLRDIKRRISSIKSTSKITRAMKMVSAAKLRRAQERMFALRPYSDKMREVLQSLAQPGEQDIHPLLRVRPRKTVEILVLTSDKGLCGAFNTNVIKAAEQLMNDLKGEGFEISVSTVGRKARDYFRRRNITIRESWTGLSGNISYSAVQGIAADLMNKYIDETFDELYLIYNEFKSVVVQNVTKLRLLPIGGMEHDEEGEMKDFLFEPAEEEIFSRLLPKSVEIQLYRTVLESRVSEEAARMTAMENATKSAEDMIERLTLEYNKARQAAITKELMDIVGGAEAIKD